MQFREFDWDQSKRYSNIEKHGIDFAAVPPIFDDHCLIREDNRLFWFLCGNEVYTDSFFRKIVLKVLPNKHFTFYKQKLSHKVEKSR